MIPRTKANYGWSDLWRAWWTSERQDRWRSQLRLHLGEFLGVDHVALTGSGRAALWLLLKATDRPYVLSPAYNCKAVAEAIHFAGKQVRWTDVEESGFNLTPEGVEAELQKLPRGSAVVLATHQYGIPCDIDAILEIAERYDALVFEDCAAALGSKIDGRNVGSFGDAAVFSFDSTKLIHAPLKAGAVAIKDPALFARVESLIGTETRPATRWQRNRTLALAVILLLIERPILYSFFHWFVFRRTDRFMLDQPGMQQQLDEKYQVACSEGQARIIFDQLLQIEDYIKNRQLQYAQYQLKLKDCRRYVRPPEDCYKEWACIRFPLIIKDNKHRFYGECVERGVDLAFSFTYLASPGNNPRADDISQKVVNPPFYSKLTDTELERCLHVLAELGMGDTQGEDARARRDGEQSITPQGVVLQR